MEKLNVCAFTVGTLKCDTPNMMVQLGPDKTGTTKFVETCRNCANDLSQLSRDQRELQDSGKLPEGQDVMRVTICNLHKFHFYSKVAEDAGAGLEIRDGACSGKNQQGQPCGEMLSEKAVAFDGKVYPLCMSCAVVCMLVFNKSGIGLMNPIGHSEAMVRAKRQRDEQIERAKKNRVQTKESEDQLKRRAMFIAALVSNVPVIPKKKGPESLTMKRTIV